MILYEFEHYYWGKTNKNFRKTHWFLVNSTITTVERQIKSWGKHKDSFVKFLYFTICPSLTLSDFLFKGH